MSASTTTPDVAEQAGGTDSDREPVTDGPQPGDLTDVPMSAVDRTASAIVMIVPFLLVFLAGWLAWDDALHWQDLVVFAVCYVPIGLGITVGFHRLFTHRSFKTTRGVRFALAALGSAAVEGPVIEWVANHRMHHAFSDRPGDPHSPHLDHGASGLRGELIGLWHAHMGWVFHDETANEERYCPDLLADPTVRFVDRTFVLWVAVGLAVPFGLGWLLTGTIDGALTGLLWGGAVRIFLMHQTTYSINSICHYFGRQDFRTTDESRNVPLLSLITFGEAWHNNHHAFPTSARHGLRRGQVDISALTISALEKVGLAWDVVRVTPERQATKAVRPAAAGGGAA